MADTTPWKVDITKTSVRVLDAEGEKVVLCGYPNAINIRRAHLISKAWAGPQLIMALENSIGPVAAWAGQYQAMHGLDDLHPTHLALIDEIKAALALVQDEDHG